MKKWTFLAALLIASTLEVTILNYFRIFDVKPNLLLAMVVVASLVFDMKWALFFGLLAGILKDAFCSSAFAFNTLLFAFWTFLVVRLSRKVSVENSFIRVALVFIIVVLNNVLTRAIFVYLGKFIALGIFFKITFFESLYTLFISLLVFRIIRPVLQS